MFQEMAIFRKKTEKISKLEGDVSTKSKRRLERPIGRFLLKIERRTRCAPLFGPERPYKVIWENIIFLWGYVNTLSAFRVSGNGYFSKKK